MYEKNNRKKRRTKPIEIVRALASKRVGLDRTEIIACCTPSIAGQDL